MAHAWTRRAGILALAMAAALTACAPTYTLVNPAPIGVAKNTIMVTPGTSWNRSPNGAFDVAWEENWTENGPMLDSIGFIGGLPDGQAIAKQRVKDDRQVPVFHTDMSPQDLVSMLESYYRIKAGATTFETKGIQPATFVGKPGLRFDYAYVGADNVKRRGRAVIAIADTKLYMMTLDAAELHYFAAALPEFEAMAAAASAKS